MFWVWGQDSNEEYTTKMFLSNINLFTLIRCHALSRHSTRRYNVGIFHLITMNFTKLSFSKFLNLESSLGIKFSLL